MLGEFSPTTYEEAAATLAAATADGYAVRIRGGATKTHWGNAPAAAQVELRTGALDRVVEHNVGDLTAIVEAGVPVAQLQAVLAGEGQMLALDPPLGIDSGQATIGGVLATADSGPLRHRYGGPRDLLLGVTVALSDGTIAHAGGKVIKNVAGYDIGKLFTGSFGTLGVILSACVRLHPLPVATATAHGSSRGPELISDAAQTLSSAPLELDSLDVRWQAFGGSLLARMAGVEARRRAERAAAMMQATGLADVGVVTDDHSLWEHQRAGQRSAELALLRILTRPSELGPVLRAVQASDGALVGRAALGIWFVEVEPEAVTELRAALPAGAVTVLQDAPPALRETLDPWWLEDVRALELMRRVKDRFDPTHTCNPGVFVGGI